MTRKTPGWENRLIEYLAGVSRSGFRPSRTDCAMFSAGGYAAMTEDVSIFDRFAGQYKSLDEGYDLLRAEGFDTHVDFAASILIERQTPLLAQRGDIAVLNAENGTYALGVVQGECVYVMTLQGLGTRPLTDAIRVFAV